VSLARTVTTDLELDGAPLKAGDRLLLWLPGANRDPRAFDRPAEVDIDRPSCPHIAFGDGPHVCIGAPLFRRLFHITLREVLAKMPDYVIDFGRCRRYDDAATFWGWRTMPARTHP
jgi:cytochrome P450